jgi:vacuolar-type H+-ATPase subunit F/Vma7
MSHIAAIGELARIGGFALAGVQIAVAEHPDAVRTAWRGLPGDVDLVILTPAARAALQAEGLGQADQRLWAVMPA